MDEKQFSIRKLYAIIEIMEKSEQLGNLRHSLAHLLAAAVLELYPDAKRTIGPAIDDGFYYDFDFSSPVSDKDLLKIMRGAGLRHLNLGVESASEAVLIGSKRLPIKAVHQEEIINYCHKIGITVAAFYIIGLENDTRETIRQTINYAKKLNTLVAQFTIGTPYPGTQFFAKMKEEGRLTTLDWPEYDTYNPVYRHQYLTAAELLRLKEKAFISYYFRPAYLLRHMPKFIKEKIYENFSHRR